MRFLCTALLLLSLPTVQFLAAQGSRENADFKLAINLYHDGLYDLAAEQLKQFVAAYPTTDQGVDARFYLGLTQLKLRQYDDARLTFQTFALTYQNNPKAPEAWWHVGESYAATGHHHEAALAFERVKVFHPRSKNAADALVAAGRHFLLSGDRDNARRVLRIVLQEYGSTTAVPAARTQLGRLYFEEGNVESAQNELKRVVEGDPSPDARAQALLILGTIEQAVGRTGQAESRYREIISSYRSSSALQGAYVGLGRLLADGGRSDESVDNFRKALAVPAAATDSMLVLEAITGLGSALAAGGKYADAVTQYNRFLLLAPPGPKVFDVLAKLAEAAARGRNYRASGEACMRLLKSPAPDSLHRIARLRLALNAEEQKNPALAIQLFSALLEFHPDDPIAPDVLYRMGSITERQIGDLRKAAAWYEQLQGRYEASPLVDDALAAAGRCHESLKDYTRALELYRSLVFRYPCSELRPETEERISMIETFEAKDKDAGLEKLALLVGDVVADRNRAELAFRLGGIYFHDLKQYEAAAAQFTNAYTAGLGPEKTGEALFLRAKAYEQLSRKNQKARQQAVEAFETFLHTAGIQALTATRKADAAVSLFRLTSATAADARHAYETLSGLVPGSPVVAEMLLKIGTLLAESDSAAAALTWLRLAMAPAAPQHVRDEAGFLSADLLFALGLTDSALSMGKLLLLRSPDHASAALLTAKMAGVYYTRGEYALAGDLYGSLTTRYFYTDVAQQAGPRLAEAKLAQGDAVEAVRLYSDLLAASSSGLPGSDEPPPSLLLSLARAQAASGDAPAAKSTLFRLLSRERGGRIAGEALTALGMLYREEGALDIATSYFRQAGSAAPGSPARREVADLLFEAGEYPDALKQYNSLISEAASDSERADYRSRIIIARLRTDDAAQANREIDLFRRTYPDRHPDLAAFELERGHLAFRRKDYPVAMKSFQTVADVFENTPSAPVASYWVGKTLEAAGNYGEAAGQLSEVVKRYPGTPTAARAHLGLGNLAYTTEKWDEAIRSYRRVVEDPSPDPELLPLAMSNLIGTYETTGAFDAALSLTRRYLEAYPNADDAFDKRIKIGTLYERLGYYDQAVLHLQGLLDEAGSDLEGEIRYYIAEANFNKGDYQQAILDFLKVPYLVTKKGKIDWTANALYMSGQAYEKMGRHEQAVTMYKQIIDRPGIDETYRAAARKEIDRVNVVLKNRTD